MLYLIEGLDGTGKTELAKALAVATGGCVLKTGADNSHNDYMDDFVVARTLAASKPSAPVILDRSILSGIAYAAPATFTQAEGIQLWLDWLSILHGQKITVIHLLAFPETRRQRDPDGFRSHKPWLDLDALIEAARRNNEGRAYFMRIQTDNITPEQAVDMILARHPRHRCDVKVFSDGWVQLIWPRRGGYEQIPKDAWTTIFLHLKQIWGVEGYPSKHPDGYWMIHPDALLIRGGIQAMVADIETAYRERGYDVEIVGPLSHPYAFAGAEALR